MRNTHFRIDERIRDTLIIVGILAIITLIAYLNWAANMKWHLRHLIYFFKESFNESPIRLKRKSIF